MWNRGSRYHVTQFTPSVVNVDLSPGRKHCIVLLGKTLSSMTHTTSLQTQKINELLEQSNNMLEGSL